MREEKLPLLKKGRDCDGEGRGSKKALTRQACLATLPLPPDGRVFWCGNVTGPKKPLLVLLSLSLSEIRSNLTLSSNNASSPPFASLVPRPSVHPPEFSNEWKRRPKERARANDETTPKGSEISDVADLFGSVRFFRMKGEDQRVTLLWSLLPLHCSSLPRGGVSALLVLWTSPGRRCGATAGWASEKWSKRG